MVLNVALTQKFHPPDQICEIGKAHFRHDLSDLFRDSVEVVDDVFWFPLEFRSQTLVLSRNTHRAGVQVALPYIDAAGGNQSSGAEIVFFGSKQCRKDNIFPRSETAV